MCEGIGIPRREQERLYVEQWRDGLVECRELLCGAEQGHADN